MLTTKPRVLFSLALTAAVAFGAVGCTGDELPDVTAPAPSPVESTEAEPTALPEGQCDPAMVEPLLGVTGAETTLEDVSTEFIPAFVASTFAPVCMVTGRIMFSTPDSDPIGGESVSFAVLRGVELETVTETARANGLSVSDGDTFASFTTEDDLVGSISWQHASDYSDFDALAAATGVDLQPDDLIVVATLQI